MGFEKLGNQTLSLITTEDTEKHKGKAKRLCGPCSLWFIKFTWIHPIQSANSLTTRTTICSRVLDAFDKLQRRSVQLSVSLPVHNSITRTRFPSTNEHTKRDAQDQAEPDSLPRSVSHSVFAWPFWSERRKCRDSNKDHSRETKRDLGDGG